MFTSLDDSAPGPLRDVIGDFERGVDSIDLTGIDAVAATNRIDAFDFIRAEAFSGVAGQLRRAGGLIEGDVDGDGIADFQIELDPQQVIESVDRDGDGVADAETVTAVVTVPSAADFLL